MNMPTANSLSARTLPTMAVCVCRTLHSRKLSKDVLRKRPTDLLPTNVSSSAMLVYGPEISATPKYFVEQKPTHTHSADGVSMLH